MAQIIKHRRGSISSLKGALAHKGELVIATGSINDLQGPFVFVADNDAAGAFSTITKIYQGSAAPTITAGTYGTTLNGVPFYSTNDKSLYILDSVLNQKIDLTGNLEGNTISAVTINSITGSRASFDTYVSASALNVTGNTQMIGTLDVNGSTTVNNNLTVTGATSVSGTTNLGSALNVTGATTLYSATTINAGLTVTGTTSVSGTTNLGSTLNVNGTSNLTGSVKISGDTSISGSMYVSGANVYISGSNRVILTYDGQAGFYSDINDTEVFSYHSDLNLVSYNNNVNISTDGTSGSTINLKNNTNISGTTTIEGATVINNNLTVTGTTSVSGTTNLGSDLNVNGNSNFTGSVRISGDTFVTGTLKVTKDATFEKDLYVSGNIYQTGSFYTQGSIVLSGSINIGDFTGDTINFGGEVNSNILPTTGATYNLGSSGQTWNNIWAETAHFTSLDLGSITLNSLSLPGDLEVSGLTTLYSSTTINSDLTVTGTTSVSGTTNLGSDLNVTGDTTFNGDVIITGLTDNRVVIVGTSGLLEDDSNFTFDGTTLKVGDGDFEVDVLSGSTRMSGSLKVGTTLDVTGATTLYSATTINAGLTVTGTTSVSGTTNLGSDLNVTGTTTLYSATTINDNLTVTGTTSVSGTTNLGSSLNVTGVTTLYSSTTINDNLTVTGTTSVSGTTNLGGALNVTGATTLYSATTINDDLTVTGTTSISGTTTINGLTTINTGLTVTDYVNISGTTTIDGSTTINNNLTVTGTTSISGVTTLGDNLNVSGTTLMGDDVSLVSGNTLYVNHIADYSNNNLDITTYGNLVLESTDLLSIELKTDNAEAGTNYLHVNQYGVDFTTYDFTSGLTHKVLLDNTGSLKLENVKLALTGSLGLSGSLDVSNNTTIHGDLYVSGNVQFLGTGSYINISASQVDLGTNIINLNTYAPFERFAGINVYDSGSNAGVTGSLLWDSVNNVWIYANPSGSDYASARFISGPKNTGSLGQETGLTNGHFTIAVGDDHIADSLLTYIGTTLALNTNKFTVDSGTGDTLIHGNFTIEGVGGTMSTGYTSYVVFRNDNDVLGFVDGSTDTQTESDRLLGYNATTGVLQFSSLIDGGTY